MVKVRIKGNEGSGEKHKNRHGEFYDSCGCVCEPRAGSWQRVFPRLLHATAETVQTRRVIKHFICGFIVIGHQEI